MENNIIFNYEIPDFKISDEELISNWIQNTIKEESKIQSDISYIFCDDEYLLDINKKYLNHDYYTDVITFDYTEENKISGDIFISIDRVKEHHKIYNTTFDNELQRVIIHGILHLIGYNDQTDEEQELMTQKEDYYLSLL